MKEAEVARSKQSVLTSLNKAKHEKVMTKCQKWSRDMTEEIKALNQVDQKNILEKCAKQYKKTNRNTEIEVPKIEEPKENNFFRLEDDDYVDEMKNDDLVEAESTVVRPFLQKRHSLFSLEENFRNRRRPSLPVDIESEKRLR